jgi:hypothetical protein
MAESGGNNVTQQKDATESKLARNDSSTKQSIGILQSHKAEQVHTLVVSLIQEHLHHSTITLHGAQTTEMTDNGSNHTRNSRNRFEVNDTLENHVFCQFTVLPAGRLVKAETNHLDGVQGQAIHKVQRGCVYKLDIQIFLTIGAVRLVKEVLVSTGSDLQVIFVAITFVTLLELNNSIYCLDKTIKGDRAARFTGIEKLSNLDNLILGECVLVPAKKGLEFIGINAIMVR